MDCVFVSCLTCTIECHCQTQVYLKLMPSRILMGECYHYNKVIGAMISALSAGDGDTQTCQPLRQHLLLITNHALLSSVSNRCAWVSVQVSRGTFPDRHGTVNANHFINGLPHQWSLLNKKFVNVDNVGIESKSCVVKELVHWMANSPSVTSGVWFNGLLCNGSPCYNSLQCLIVAAL